MDNYKEIEFHEINLKHEDYVLVNGELHFVTIAGGQSAYSGDIAITYQYHHINARMFNFLKLKAYRKIK